MLIDLCKNIAMLPIRIHKKLIIFFFFLCSKKVDLYFLNFRKI